MVTYHLTSGADFHSWHRYVRMALKVRNKLGFIDWTIRKPPDNDKDSRSWSCCNDMVATWLMNSVSKKIGRVFCLCLLLNQYGIISYFALNKMMRLEFMRLSNDCVLYNKDRWMLVHTINS